MLCKYSMYSYKTKKKTTTTEKKILNQKQEILKINISMVFSSHKGSVSLLFFSPLFSHCLQLSFHFSFCVLLLCPLFVFIILLQVSKFVLFLFCYSSGNFKG